MKASFVRFSLIFSFFSLFSSCGSAATFPEPPAEKKTPGLQTIVFSGGCFWGIEGIFESLKGVRSAVSGYCGGSKETADYETVSTGTTGHAESVQVVYDSSVITLGQLLKIFFSVAHDPTQLNYQGPDHGTQYRSAIFTANADQKKVVSSYVETLQKSGYFSGPIVTQINDLKSFFPAEEYHQHFMKLNPNYPYIVYWDRPKLEQLKKQFPEWIQPGN